MGLIIFEVQKKGRKATKNLNQELLWYEWAERDAQGNVTKEGHLHHLRGGKLEYRYDFDAKKMSVSTAPVRMTTYKTEDNKEAIEQWIEDNRLELKLSEASGTGITVTFPDQKKEAVKRSLSDTEFLYEIF
jgi:hypothetical protein